MLRQIPWVALYERVPKPRTRMTAQRDGLPRRPSDAGRARAVLPLRTGRLLGSRVHRGEALLPSEVTRPECLAGRGPTPAEDGGGWDEDDDANLVPAAEPEPGHVYDLACINRALALVTDEPDETGAPGQ